jgi:UDP-4-amino-4-deoxy-L-arabinose-oxoglutarate aminotransferase
MDIQAAIGLHQIKRLDSFNQRRGTLFKRYLDGLGDIDGLLLPWEGDATLGHCYHLFVLRILPEIAGMSRDAFVQALKEENIGTGIHYRPAHLHAFYKDYYAQHPEAMPKDGLPECEWSGERLMSLPLWPGLTEGDQDQVMDAIRYLMPK